LSGANTTAGGNGFVSFTEVPAQAPEINPASAASAMTLLLGGLSVMRGRKRRA
jgi:hypothetical protein